jgi:hypothetical protein
MLGTRVILKVMSLLVVGGTLMTGTCLPDNYWAGKWGEVINRGIFGVINAVLGAATGGGVQV